MNPQPSDSCFIIYGQSLFLFCFLIQAGMMLLGSDKRENLVIKALEHELLKARRWLFRRVSVFSHKWNQLAEGNKIGRSSMQKARPNSSQNLSIKQINLRFYYSFSLPKCFPNSKKLFWVLGSSPTYLQWPIRSPASKLFVYYCEHWKIFFLNLKKYLLGLFCPKHHS